MRRIANLLFDTKAVLGEGPVWDYKKQSLFWVDIEGYKLHLYIPAKEKTQSWTFDEMIGAAVPIHKDGLLLAMEKGLAAFDSDAERLTKLEILENSNDRIRFNDGKVGPDGSFWVGTMDKNCAPKAGKFYRISENFDATIQIPNTSISNGMAWSSNKSTFYYIDSPSFQIKAFDFDMVNGAISDAKTAVEVPTDYGSPDGMCIDEEDMLWVAHWGGSCVRRWNPLTGQVIGQIDVPAPHVTSCCFGEEDLKTLYITTARSGLSQEQLKEFPQSGGLFSIELDIKGTPIDYFKNNR